MARKWQNVSWIFRCHEKAGSTHYSIRDDAIVDDGNEDNDDADDDDDDGGYDDESDVVSNDKMLQSVQQRLFKYQNLSKNTELGEMFSETFFQKATLCLAKWYT